MAKGDIVQVGSPEQAAASEPRSGRLSTANNASGGKYNVQFHTYPEDLYSNGANKYGNSWVMININVVSGTKFTNRYSYVELSQEENRNFSNTEARRNEDINTITNVIASSSALGGIQGGLAGFQSALNNLSTDQIGNLKNILQKGGANALVEAVKGVIKGGTLAGLALIPALVNKKETKRIDTAIQLPMPNNLITGYTMDWGEADTAIFDMMARAPSIGFNAIKGAFTGDTSALSNAGSDVANLAAAVSLGTQSFFGSGAVSAASGLAANPKKEMIFNGVGFRNFTLEYRFFPKTRSEMQNIQAIISDLKFHMHPEYKSQGRFTFLYPSEFDITFYHRGEENVFVNKIATSVLKNMRVNYTPDGLWATHDDGAPNAIQITLEFQELSILTKEAIDKGY